MLSHGEKSTTFFMHFLYLSRRFKIRERAIAEPAPSAAMIISGKSFSPSEESVFCFEEFCSRARAICSSVKRALKAA